MVWRRKRRGGRHGGFAVSPSPHPALGSESTLVHWVAHATAHSWWVRWSLRPRLRSASFASFSDSLLGNQLAISCVEKGVEIVLARDLQFLDVLLERVGHRRWQHRKKVELERFPERAAVGPDWPRALLV